MKFFFKDLKVVELANVLAGPAVGMFFAELGAEVIKVENKLTGGDVTRTWKTSFENEDSKISAYYASVNWNKRTVFADLNNETDRQTIYALIKDADIVISNYKPGDDIKLGMDHASLRKINQRLIYAHITGFGENNPRTAYDLILQAETGFMHMNGTPESGPLKMPVALIDVLAGHQLKEAILLSLIERMKTGKGSVVRVSLFDAAIASLANQAGNWLMTGHDPQPIGSLHPNIAPYGEIFHTKDEKKIVLAIGSNKQFASLCHSLNVNELITDPKFSTNTQRVKNRTELFSILVPLIQKQNADELMSGLLKNDVPAGMIRSLKDVFENKNTEQLILTENSKENGKSKRVRTVAFHISKCDLKD